MHTLYGKTTGLKANQQRRLQNLYRRKIPPTEIVSHEMARQLCSISHEIRRQVALLVTRKGEVAQVIVGDHRRIQIPDVSAYRWAAGRLRGLRCIHTHLHPEALSQEDITDLVLLGLDLMVCIEVDARGMAGPLSIAHILPSDREGKGWAEYQMRDIGQVDWDFLGVIESLEEEFVRTDTRPSLEKEDSAILIGVTTGAVGREEESLNELEELARSDNIHVSDRVVQRIQRADPRFLMGKGKVTELCLRCLQTGANLLIFNQELSPTQVKSLADFTALKIIDRAQLILDIFSRRAVTREGKIQVELAQLKYVLPRLAAKNTAMSRLTGGIGGRGPGETKLEINRRRVRERIVRLNRELEEIKLQRDERRRLRAHRGLPVISIVGYTNVGKSTLLNSLTRSRVGAKDRLFETLDPSSRRLRFPRDHEAIITDTVGFIRNLPESLLEAFAATLEELHEAHLLLHVVDAASPRLQEQAAAVSQILTRLSLHDIPTLLLLNKSDLLAPREAELLAKRMGGIAISAIHPPTLLSLVEKIQEIMWPCLSTQQTETVAPPL